MPFRLNHLLALPFFLMAIGVLSLQGPDLPMQSAAGGALAIVVVGMWATRFAAEHLTSLLFFLAAMVLGIAEATAVFSGFSAGAFWLLFGGMILGSAVGRTGLGARLARAMALRMGVSYTGLLVGIAAVALALSFVMPSSTGRVVLLMPVAVSLADAFRFESGSKGRLGITVTAALSAVVPGFAILPANVPNLVMVGAAESVYGLEITYAEFLLLHFPVLGFLKAAAIVLVARLLFPSQLPDLGETPESSTHLSNEERRLAVLLLMALSLWATDFLHGIAPSWVALGAGLACFLPPFRLIDADEIGQAIQIKPLLFIAGVLSLGAVVTSTGFGDYLAAAFLSIAGLEPGDNAANFATIVGASIATSVLGTAPTVPAVWTPLAEGLSVATGIPLKSVVMMQVLAFSTLILPYQVPPAVVGLALGKVPLRQGIISVFCVAMITLFILLPLDYLWWEALGQFND
jgi:di/tricarboxylate transporter